MSFNFMAAVTIRINSGAQKNKVCHCFHCFPIYLPWSDGTRCDDLSFLNFKLQANFFTLLFHFHQRIFRSSSLSAIMVMSSAYLRLLMFLPTILIPACASSSPTFLMMYNAYRLNKQGDNTQPWCTPSPIWIQSVVPWQVLTVASWPASQKAGQVVWYSHLFKNFTQCVVIHTVKGFGI